MKILLSLLLLSTSVYAAKPVPCSDRPFCFTVSGYVEGHLIGMNISWDKKEAFERNSTTYQNAAREMYHDAPYLFKPGVARFHVEWPRFGYSPLTIYGCVGVNGSFEIVNDLEECQ